MALNTLADLCVRRWRYLFTGLRNDVLKIETEFYLSNLQYTRSATYDPAKTNTEYEIISSSILIKRMHSGHAWI